jgi:hypothetical protein
MKKKILILFLACSAVCNWSCHKTPAGFRILTPAVLKDKIAGGWAGKMIGVTYGAPTEFRATGTTFDDSIKWVPGDIKGSMWQDDLYVQLTFLMAMDQYGVDAPAKKFHELFAKAGYALWHANVQARKNYYDSIFPPESGRPEFNFHADDIDFQIEADYVGFMCPGMPNQAVKICDKIGHIMNYGEGYYGGIFVAALYAEAFFENDISRIIETALQSIPAESDYAKIVRDVILLHNHYPADWNAAWKELEAKWGDVDICGAGVPFNIDAKLNGAYIVMGLLYGNGDPLKTLEVATRCGQDSDCNPSNAMSVLGVIKGFNGLPADMRDGVTAIGDSTFINTNYTFKKAVENTYRYAVDFVRKAGGEVKENEILVKMQDPVSPPFEVSFPNLVFDHRISIFEDSQWRLKGKWQTYKMTPWGETSPVQQSRYAEKAGDNAELTFNGTGIALKGNWVKDGGKAVIYLDGKLQRTIDSYFYWSKQEHQDMVLWHAFGLEPGDHTVKLEIRGEKRPESSGTGVFLTQALVFKTAPKKNEGFRYSFEK